MPIKRRNRRQRGFTLVVVAGLFMAFSVIAGVMIERGSVTRTFDQQAVARAQLSRLNYAILNYYRMNNSRYPCPARYDVLPSSTSPVFGDEWGGCQIGTQTGIDVLKLTDNSTDSNDIRGMVPINVLVPYGADMADAIDPWGNRIMYVVNRQLTPSGSGTATICAATPGCAPGTCSCTTATNRTFITEGITSTAVSSADFVLLSYGPDKLGAIARDATAPTISCAPSNVTRYENCDTDMVFTYRPNYTPANATATTRYDDILSFSLAQDNSPGERHMQ